VYNGPVIVRNLGSGSAGNATVVSRDGRAILIDAGLPLRRLRAGLDGLALEAVLVTHCHGDHLKAVARRLGVPFWMDAGNAREVARKPGLGDLDVRLFDGRPFRAGPFEVSPFPLPHPGGARWHSYGFLVACGGRRLAYATDLGHVPAHAREVLAEADVLFLESNHDPELERNSGRPPWTVDWVLSDHGHLSNEQCAEALARAGRTHTVVLGHLSRECNVPALALRTARRALRPDARLLAASQDVGSEGVRV
jgi:phosphoribosyl 1,2-cyclic phosphodiesterase